MKSKSLFRTLMISLIAIIFITSCAKEVQHPSVDHNNTSTNQQPPSSYQQQQKTLNLVASTWQRNADGVYVNFFKGAMQYGGGASPVRVYLDQNGGTLISSGAITFMSGQLWASIAYPDIKIFYSPGPNRTLPFSRLNIKVVFG
jgi:hypothetical protein